MADDQQNQPGTSSRPNPAGQPEASRRAAETPKPDAAAKSAAKPGAAAKSAAKSDADRKPDEDPIAGKVYDSRIMRRLARYLRPYWLAATISSIAVCIKSLCDVAGPILVMVGIDRYLTPKLMHEEATSIVAHWLAYLSPLARRLPADPWLGITELAALYCILITAGYLFEIVQIYLMQWTGQKIMFDLRRDIFRHMQRMHVGFFDLHAVGRLVTRLTSDVDAVNDMFTDGILAIVNDFFMLIIMAGVMLAIRWWLALVAFSVLPLIFIVTRIFRNHVRESYRRVRAAIARINSFTQEHISGMSVVQLFNREKRAYVDFEEVNRLHMVAFKDTIFAYALYYPAVDILSSVAISLVVWCGGFSVLARTSVTIGMLAMFIQYSQRFWRPIQDLSDKYNILQAAMAACERIYKLLDTAPEILSPAHPLAGDGSNRIQFEHVWFTYQKLTDEQRTAVQAALQGHDFSRAEEEAGEHGALAPAADPDGAALAAMDGIEWILKDVSFTIERGQTVAIVGHTGAGKTTLTSLMMRFYDVTAGRILLDGVDLREHDLKALREHFAVVLQDPFLFTGTIGENIRLGNERIGLEEMRRAARDVKVLDFVETLPGQFSEPVRERGNSLSTGQKQLINFARALAYNPRILILDEATSSVDTDTELRIRGALDRMVEGRTSVLIAHRLSTVQRADTILVMHKGQLREMGSHQELLAARGLYWKLYELQYKDQEIGLGAHAATPLAQPSAASAI
jgi:ATP-binding cassette subfamily B protein